MKFGINKNVVTLAQHEEAKQMIAEYKHHYKNGLFSDLIQSAVSANAEAIREGAHYLDVKKILEIESCEITTNRGRLTAWIDCTVKVDYRTIVKMSFDGLDAIEYGETGKVSAYILTYKNNN